MTRFPPNRNAVLLRKQEPRAIGKCGWALGSCFRRSTDPISYGCVLGAVRLHPDGLQMAAPRAPGAHGPTSLLRSGPRKSTILPCGRLRLRPVIIRMQAAPDVPKRKRSRATSLPGWLCSLPARPWMLRHSGSTGVTMMDRSRMDERHDRQTQKKRPEDRSPGPFVRWLVRGLRSPCRPCRPCRRACRRRPACLPAARRRSPRW